MIDIRDEQHRNIIHATYQTWVSKGMGEWVNWSMPWASILHGRMGSKDMAYYCLQLLQDIFIMPGYATRYSAQYRGFTTIYGSDLMQVEASIAASAAVLELYVQCVQGEIQIFPSLPDRFKDAAFAGIRAEGAFLISGERRNGNVESIHIFSEKGAALRLRNPIPGKVYVESRGATVEVDDSIIEMETVAGEVIRIRPTT
jgi:hypothetical protein